jgi:nucleotide-binding universal stress UspA family protein
MKPFRKILVPVDFSEHSERALRTAVMLARSYDAQLTIVHVYEPITMAVPQGYEMIGEVQLQRLFEELQRALVQQKELAQSEAGPGLPVETQLLHGFAASEVCDLAKQAGFDLIVMGTHGRRGLSHALLGSVAERVVRMAPCAVLTVRAPKSAP